MFPPHVPFSSPQLLFILGFTFSAHISFSKCGLPSPSYREFTVFFLHPHNILQRQNYLYYFLKALKHTTHTLSSSSLRTPHTYIFYISYPFSMHDDFFSLHKTVRCISLSGGSVVSLHLHPIVFYF